MAWQVALVLDTEYSIKDISALVHQMPIWAANTPTRQEAASTIRSQAGELWTPDPALTLYSWAGTTDREKVCADILGTLLEHHPHAAYLELIGVPASPALIEILGEVGFKPAASQLRGGLPFRKPIEMLNNVRKLFLDASQWKTTEVLYQSFFTAVGAPAWHGKNFDALKDSIVTGGINKIEVPYSLVIENFGEMPRSIRAFAEQFVEFIQNLEAAGCPIAIQTTEGRSNKILNP